MPPDFAFVDIRRQDFQAHAPGLRDVGKSAVKSPLIADDRRHELGREMGFQIGALEGDARKAGTVRFAEGVAGKAHHHLPDLPDLFLRYPPLPGAGREALLVVDELPNFVFLGKHFAQSVGFGVGKAGNGHGGFGDVLLVDHDAVSFIQHISQQRMDGLPGSPAKPADVFADERVGRRPDDAAVDDDVLEIAHPGLLLQEAGGRAFDVKAAHGLAPGDGLPGGRIVFRLPALFVEVDPVAADAGNRIPDNPQAAVAEQIDLHHAGFLGGVFLPLNHRHALGGRFQRNVFVYGVGGDHNTADVNGNVTRQPDNPLGQANDLRPRLREVELLQFRQLPQSVQQVAVFRCRFPEPGQAFGDLPDLPVGEPVHLGRFADGHPGPEGHVVADHGRMACVLRQDRIEHCIAFVPGKVDIDVRRVLAARVEKTLEIEVVLDRAHVGDSHAVGHQRGRTAAAPADARAAGDNVLHHQKIGAKPHLPDDLQFVLQPLDDRFGQVVSVAFAGAPVGSPAQELFGGVPGGLDPGRQHQIVARSAKSEPFGNFAGSADGFRPDIETLPVHCRRSQPCVCRGRVGRIQPGKVGVAVDGPQQAVHLCIGRIQKTTAGHGHRRHTETAGDFAQVQGAAVGFARQCRGDRRTGRISGLQHSGAAGQHHQSFGYFGNGGLQVKRGFFRETATGNQAAQVPIAGRAFHQGDGPFTGCGIGQLGTHDRFDPFGFAACQERPQAVEIVGVRQRQLPVTQSAGHGADLSRGACAPHQRVVGSDDERDHWVYAASVRPV